MRVINALNIVKEVKSKVKKEAKEKLEKAGQYLCDGEFTIAKQVKLIEKEPDKTTLIDNVEGVEVWEKIQYSLSCKEFLDLINY